MQVGICKLSPAELDTFRALIRLFARVFEEEHRHLPSFSYLAEMLADPRFHVYVYLGEKEVLGGLTAFEMPRYYSQHSELYIYDIAVEPAYQKQGIGRKLMEAISAYAAAHQVENIMVEAHEDDEPAILFYQSFRGTREQVVHFNLEVQSPL